MPSHFLPDCAGLLTEHTISLLASSFFFILSGAKDLTVGRLRRETMAGLPYKSISHQRSYLTISSSVLRGLAFGSSAG